MTVAQKEECNKRKRDKRAKKTVAEKEAWNKRNRDKKAKRTNEKRVQKIKRAKGLISNEDDWLTTPAFAIDEAQTESDDKYRDSDDRHYLLKMNKKCHFCGALGFESEVQEKTKIQRTQKKNWFILVIFAVVKEHSRAFLTTTYPTS